MDALSDLLKSIQLSAKIYACRAVGRPWNLQVLYRPQGIFHSVIQGQCYLRECSSDKVLLLQAGDSVAFPTGGNHWVSDSPESLDLDPKNVVKVNDDEGLMLLKTGDITISTPAGDSPADDQATILLSGTVTFDSSINHPFLESLPCFIQISSQSSEELQRYKTLTSLMIEESSNAYPGQQLIVDHIAEVFFVQLLREHMRKEKHSNDYMTALFDPHIGVALNLIHKETDQRWTVESLAEASAMGRTAFTQKFVDMVGETPKAYLTITRLMKAKAKLQNTNESMISIAQGAGYASEAAFGKAIKKHFNTTPGKLRKQH